MTRILVKVVDFAALVFRRRAVLLEAAGAVLLVVAAWQIAPTAGVALGGAVLILKAADIDRSSKP